MGDELSVNSVDLIDLDPLFNSDRAYNATHKDETGRPLPDRIEVFCDLLTLDEAREPEIRHLPVASGVRHRRRHRGLLAAFG